MESTAALVNAVGGEAVIEGDTLLIAGGKPLRGGEVRTFGDHRIAMAAAVAACYSTAPVVIDDETAVAKSYPGFWTDFDSLQV
jgi:3-phosphoshikimate 1-carboxyvinyltransferase